MAMAALSGHLFCKQIVSSFLQFLDQTIGATGSDDRGELVAPQREIADRSVEIDIDHPAAADQVIYAHGAAIGLQELGFDDFTASARFRSRLGINDEGKTLDRSHRHRNFAWTVSELNRRVNAGVDGAGGDRQNFTLDQMNDAVDALPGIVAVLEAELRRVP